MDTIVVSLSPWRQRLFKISRLDAILQLLSFLNKNMSSNNDVAIVHQPKAFYSCLSRMFLKHDMHTCLLGETTSRRVHLLYFNGRELTNNELFWLSFLPLTACPLQ